jgi:sortase A
MGRDLPVFLGISTEVLDQGGAGWDPESSGLTEPGTVVLFAHRVSRGGPFLSLDRLRPGSAVYLQGTDGALYRYRVVMTEVTSPSWAAVLAWKPSSGWGVTLVACHPPGSVAHRLVVHAELEQII